MKYMNLKKRMYPLDLQLFAAGGDDDGDDSGGDDQDDPEDDSDGDDDGDDEGEDEAKYTKADIEAAVKARLSRERRKWQRQQRGSGKSDKPQSKKPRGDADNPEDPDVDDRISKAEQRAEAAETRALCLELGVAKKAVSDVVVLAQARAKDGLDIEDAIEEVLDDYPHFKKELADTDDEDEDDAPGKKKKKAKFVRGTNNSDKPETKTEQQAYLDAKYGKNPYFKKK